MVLRWPMAQGAITATTEDATLLRSTVPNSSAMASRRATRRSCSTSLFMRATSVLNFSSSPFPSIKSSAPVMIASGVRSSWAALAVNSRCTTDTPVYVQGNADAIEDAIRNLVENAVTHSPLGEEVTVEVLADGRVNVGDSGPGVPIDIQERIFERFWRGTSVDTAGVGLGLAIVKKIMEAHRGSAVVRNNADL